MISKAIFVQLNGSSQIKKKKSLSERQGMWARAGEEDEVRARHLRTLVKAYPLLLLDELLQLLLLR